MSDAIKELRDYLAKSPSVIYPEDVLAYLPAIEDENTKLRELAVFQSVIFKHMSTCPTTDCQVCPVNDECAESVYLEGVLGIDDKETSWLVQWRSEDAADVRAENAKLRMLIDLKQTCWKYVGWCSECPYNSLDDEHDDCSCTVQEKINSLACELGIKVS